MGYVPILKKELVPLLQLKKVRSLLLAGATDHEGFLQQLRQMEAAFKLSAKDLRSQVVREACITLGYVQFIARHSKWLLVKKVSVLIGL